MEITHNQIPFRFKELTWDILGACIEVHRALGPGLVESARKSWHGNQEIK